MELSSVGLHGAHRRGDLVARYGRHEVAAAIRRGALRRLWPGVVIEAKRVLDVWTRAAAALLAHGPEAVISSHTAALLYGCTAAESARTHVLVPYRHASRTRGQLVVHHGSMYRCDAVELDGLQVLALDRVVCDLLCTARHRDALAVADQALALQPASAREAFRGRVQRRLAKRLDPRGTRSGAFLLELATGRAESPPESWLLLTVVELGFPLPEANWWLMTPAGLRLYRLDLAWPELRIVLEYDGYAVHADRSAEDAERESDLRRRGWIVVRASVDDLRDSRRLEGQLRGAFRTRGYDF